MFIKVTDAATGMPVFVNTGNVSKFEHSDNPDAVSVAYFVGGDCAHIKESLPEIEGALHDAGQFEALPPTPVITVDQARKKFAEAIAAQAQADADEAARLRGEWPKSRA